MHKVIRKQPFTGRMQNASHVWVIMITMLFGLSLSHFARASNDLPVLNDRVSALMSPEKERSIGRAWLRSFRGQNRLIYDPIITEYVENLVYEMVSNSELSTRDIETLVVDNADINAFAVPGGIIGINAGLFLHADNEDELAAVIAHEIAHLSQRHFARMLENAKQNQWTQLAALAASIAIAAAGAGGDAAMATMTLGQAFSLDAQLRFNRRNEQEADRVGMQTLVNAGRDPYAMAEFFRKLQKSMTYSGDRPPEFLLTHPVTESRIADTAVRAEQMRRVQTLNSEAFAFVKARIAAALATNLEALITRYLENKKNLQSPSRTLEYALAYAYFQDERIDEALKLIRTLREDTPDDITFVFTEAEILIGDQRFEESRHLLEKYYRLNPDNYAISLMLGRTLLALEDNEAVSVLSRASELHPKSLPIWYLLASAESNAKRLIGAHRAKAEWLYLQGRYDRAIQQLKLALPLSEKNFQLSSKINARIQDIEAGKSDIKL